MKKIKFKSFKDMRGFTKIKAHGDINEHVLAGFDEWQEDKAKDPADRVITAFALRGQMSIVTSDKKIKAFYKNVIW